MTPNSHQSWGQTNNDLWIQGVPRQISPQPLHLSPTLKYLLKVQKISYPMHVSGPKWWSGRKVKWDYLTGRGVSFLRGRPIPFNYYCQGAFPAPACLAYLQFYGWASWWAGSLLWVCILGWKVVGIYLGMVVQPMCSQEYSAWGALVQEGAPLRPQGGGNNPGSGGWPRVVYCEPAQCHSGEVD